MKKELLELQKSVESRKKYMDKISQDIRVLEEILQNSGLDKYIFKLFSWEFEPKCNRRRLRYYHTHKSPINKNHLIHETKNLIEWRFEVREKAHSEMKEFIDELGKNLKVNFNI